MIRKLVVALILVLCLSGCQSRADAIREKGEAVKACVESGGEWYNTKGWGDGCNFDTREK